LFNKLSRAYSSAQALQSVTGESFTTAWLLAHPPDL